MSVTERFLLAMALILAVPHLIWRLGRTERWAPLVVVQIVAGILMGPGVLGAVWPSGHAQLFSAEVMTALNGVAWWGVMLFVWLAGLELDLQAAWRDRRESGITAALALLVPLLLGTAVAAVMWRLPGWAGPQAQALGFTLGVGMACAVTALPILVLLMGQLQLLRSELGQRVLRYASVDDVALWGVLAVVLADWQRAGLQLAFLLAFALLARGLRLAMPRLALVDRWALGLVWLALCALGADACGLHFMVGAFLSGLVIDQAWLGAQGVHRMRQQVLVLLMPVFFLSTGLRTQWQMGGWAVVAAAAALLAAAVLGKRLGVALAGRWLGWPPGQARLIGWLLQTKALIMIIFANVLLDRGIISASSFTALLLMAVASTVLTLPMARRCLQGAEASAGAAPTVVPQPSGH